MQALADAFRRTIADLAKEGKLSLLIQGMLKHPGHEHVQAAACKALEGLAASDDNRVKVAAEGGIAALLGSMQRHPIAKVQEAVCRALQNLTVNVDNQVKVAAEGSVGAIVTALQGHPTDAKIQ